MEVDHVLILTHRGNYLNIRVIVRVGSISASCRFCGRSCTQMLILDFPIDP